MAQHATAPAMRSPSPPRRLRSIAIVPAYNEASSLATVIDEIRSVDPDLEVVVINDASTDGTARVAVAAGVPVVHLPFNVGIGGAVQTGYKYALEHGFDLAIQIDGDGQHDPSEIGSWLHRSSTGAPTSSSGRASSRAGATAARAFAGSESASSRRSSP